ncbi:hypothetical protein [Caulobacter hibisci]|uniref:Uncharacterized protein n=1 Tax=Caulobacter hibisci TaxID=2035993 RepID=A0ABS0SS54_9CAUL|nr:hypothetical protein [Caulobacter hibisci]MBI1682329.1 hypothetical protein [Caulobacter hibisci]
MSADIETVQTVNPDRWEELGDFVTALFEWGCEDPNDIADEVKRFLVSDDGLWRYRDLEQQPIGRA